MTSMVDESLIPVDVRVDDKMIHIRFRGGRVSAAPVSPYPRLRDAEPTKRVRLELNGKGYGIHWPDVDEDITVRGLLSQAELAEVA